MPEVSIIVPVYNAEKAIGRCVDSILHQEYTDIEVILIDDGSRDGSPALLDAMAEKDSRVRVIHQENAGVSAARNHALDIAQGTYIQFLDADDWIPEDSTKLLVRTMQEKECDLTVASFYRVVGDLLSVKSSISTEKVLTLRQYADLMMEAPSDYYFGVLWNKLYKRQIIEENHIRMDESLSFCEDFVFNLEYLLHVATIAPLQAPVYYYVRTEGSLVAKNLTLSRIVQMKTGVFQYYNDFYKNILDEETYRAQRLNIARFLIDAARDDMTVPIMPGTMKVGEETVRVPYHAREDSVQTALYYMSRMYERYLHTLAMRYDLTLKDIRVFDAVRKAVQPCGQNEAADFTGFTPISVLASMEKLHARGYLDLQVDAGTMHASVTEKGNAFCSELDTVQMDLMNACFEVISKEEKYEWLRLTHAVSAGLRKKLVKDEADGQE